VTTDHLAPARPDSFLLPTVHPVRPAVGYVNDPNGLVRIDGTYHLYFQYVTDTPRIGAVRWGHLTSSDLLRWGLEPPAILPGAVGADVDGVWSGNTVVDPSGLVHAFYSGFRSGHPYQSIVRATSRDGGYSFGEAVELRLDPSTDEGVTQFRDPFVWAEPDTWSMLVGCERNGRGAARLYRSRDLAGWSFAGYLAEADTADPPGIRQGAMWECPQYLEGGRWGAVLYGAFEPVVGVTTTTAAIGRREGDRLHGLRYEPLDYGPDLYAPSLGVFGDRRVMFGWIREQRDQAWAIADDWSGLLSFPREVALEGDTLRVTPARELSLLRRGLVVESTTGDISRVPLPYAFEIELDLTESDSILTIGLSCSDGDFASITVHAAACYLLLRRECEGSDARSNRDAFTFPIGASDGRRHLRILVDRSVIEMFSSSGRAATARVYPTSPESWAIQTSRRGGDIAVRVHVLGLPAQAGPSMP
jgi:beta-fructofuranosidase